MGRIVAIDYGRKRVGIAVTDEMQIIATGIATVAAAEIFPWLQTYFREEHVDSVVVGLPLQMDNTASESAHFIEPFVNRFRKVFPEIPLHRYDERFTSVMAERTLLEAGVGKKKSRDKEKIDTISAVLLLQSFLMYKSNNV